MLQRFQRQNGRSRRSRPASLRAVILGTAAWAAFAPSPAAAAEDETTLEPVIVTARRIEENLQEVPLTVNVLTAEALARSGVQRMVDIAALVPNVSWTNNGSSVRLGSGIAIRGIKSGDSVPAFDPGVGVYIDDVYQASGTSFENSLLDISEIQVLKGPQGTLFGRNTTAGALVIRTRLPSLSDTYVNADVMLGNYELRQARVVANFPLGASMALKVSAISRDREGYNLNRVTGKRDVNDENHYGGQAQLLFKPNDELQFVARAHWYEDRTAGQTPSCFGVSATLGSRCPEHPTFLSTLDRVVSADGPNSADRKMWGTSVHASWRPANDYEFTSVTAYGHVDTEVFHDVDFVAGEFVRSGGILRDEWQVSQEFRVVTPQNARARGVAGVYYVHENKPVLIPLTVLPAVFSRLGASTTPPSPYANPQGGTTDSNTITDSYAIFGQGQFDVTDKLTLEAGLRYTIDKKDFRFSQTLDAPFIPYSFIFGPPIAGFVSDERWDALTGTASASLELADGLMGYVRYARGYKSGGYNANVSPAGFDPRMPFDPEYIDSYEVGLKFESADGRLRANGAAFTIDYKDLQIQVEDPITRIKRIGNDSKATSEGFEGDIAVIPFDGLVVTASAGYQKAKSATGTRLTNVPKINASTNATYSTPIAADMDALVSMTVIYRDHIYLNTANTVKSASFTQINARIGVETDRWGVYVWSNNLTDVARAVDFFGGTYAAGHTYINPPRTVGVELTARF